MLAGTYTLDQSGSALLINFPERTYRSHGETYLALYAVDLNNTDEIVAFANDYAHLDGAEMLWAYENADLVVRREPDTVVLSAQRDAIAAGNERSDFDPELLEDFRFAARALRDLTSAWRVTSGQAEPGEIEWTWFYGKQPTLEETTSLLVNHLPRLLRRLHPRLDIEELQSSDTPVAVVVNDQYPDLHLDELCAAALQPRRCQAEIQDMRERTLPSGCLCCNAVERRMVSIGLQV